LAKKRFYIRKTSVILSVLCIGLAIFLSVFCYFIVPDNSPNANYQIPEIALSKPFSSYNFLVSYSENASNISTFEKLISGSISNQAFTPIHNYTIKNDTAWVEKYIGIDENNQVLAGNSIVVPLDKKDIKKIIKAKTSFLGTDALGRDILSRIIVGMRISLFVGFLSVFLSLVIGITFGAIAGYFGGLWDKIISIIINIFWSIPSILLVFTIVLAFGKGLTVIFLAIGLSMWVDVARMIRGQVLQIKTLTYIEAAQSFGISTVRIIVLHILPNCIGPLLVICSSNFATAILMEAGLSYLGLGVQPPIPSCGNMLNENFGYAIGGQYSIAIAPSLVIVFLVISFNILGNNLRDYFDTKTTFE
jgi:peptide/nickel transport system permease protein